MDVHHTGRWTQKTVRRELCGRGWCSVAELCQTLCNPMDCSTPGSSDFHGLPEFAQIHVHWVGAAIEFRDQLKQEY